jgi:hypothetical protein
LDTAEIALLTGETETAVLAIHNFGLFRVFARLTEEQKMTCSRSPTIFAYGIDGFDSLNVPCDHQMSGKRLRAHLSPPSGGASNPDKQIYKTRLGEGPFSSGLFELVDDLLGDFGSADFVCTGCQPLLDFVYLSDSGFIHRFVVSADLIEKGK